VVFKVPDGRHTVRPDDTKNEIQQVSLGADTTVLVNAVFLVVHLKVLKNSWILGSSFTTEETSSEDVPSSPR